MAGTGVGKFSSTASNNTSNLTVNFAENMAPSNVNNAARELMGHMRDMYEQLGDGYFEFGDGDGTYTVARSDADTITITSSSDISSVYFAGRKIRITDGGANVVEGTIASSSHSSTTQTVNLTGISLASGTPTKVELGIDTAAFGGRVILDDDGDTYIEAPTDDTIDIYVAGAKDFQFETGNFKVLSGSNIAFATNSIAYFGDGNNLQISSDGTHGKIAESGGSGNLVLSGQTIRLEKSDGEIMLEATNDAGVDIRHNNITKLVTSATGIDITGAFTATAASTITTADNTDTLTLTSTDADANIGPNLRLYRNSSSPADGDQAGLIRFDARNDNSQDFTVANIFSFVNDASDGTEDGAMLMSIMLGGTARSRIWMGSATAETVFNDDSQDIDFRVESNGNTHMLFVDGGNDCVNIGASSDRGGLLNVEGNGGVVIRVDDNNTALKLQSTDTDANAGPLLMLERSNNSAAAADVMGQIQFRAQNVANEAIEYANIISQINDATDGAEDGILSFQTMISGTSREGIRISDGGVVVNELSQDIDFRVETDGYTESFLVNAGANQVNMNKNITNADSAIDNQDGALRVMNNTTDQFSACIRHDGNNADRYGLKVQCGSDDASGTNFAIVFADGDNHTQGSITFTSGTVTYGAFTAHHPCIIPNADNDSSSIDNAYPYGTLLEITSLGYTQKDGSDTERGIIYNVQKTSTAYSKKVLGSYGSSMNGGYENKTNEHQALILGDGHILCNNEKGNIAIGDGICSSSTVGIGMKADKMAMIIGIAQEDVSFSGSETKLVAVQYGVRQFTPWTD